MVVTRQWQIVERRHLVYEPEPTRFIYHRASEIEPLAAEALIEAARAQAVENALQEIEKLICAVRRGGKAVVAAGVPGGNSKLPRLLSEILSAHSRIHAAEGAFYRDALADACGRVGLRVARTPERDLFDVASKASGCSYERTRDRLGTLGKQIGPPWAQDQKLATLAALASLSD